jgi:hypothetical protein
MEGVIGIGVSPRIMDEGEEMEAKTKLKPQ